MRLWLKIVYAVLVLLCITYIFVATSLVEDLYTEKVCKQVDAKILNDDFLLILPSEVVNLVSSKKVAPIGLIGKEIQFQEIEFFLETLPYIDKADCYQTRDGNLKIEIKQRVPVCRLITNSEMCYLDKNGVKMPPSSHASLNKIVVSGCRNIEYIKEHILPLIYRIESDELLSAQIVQIDITPTYNINLYSRIGDHKIQLGKIDNIDLKISKLIVFYTKIINQAGWSTYNTVDLRYKNQIICTRNSFEKN